MFVILFENPNETSTPLDLNAERRDSLTARCLGVVLCFLFPGSAFCQWFCSPSFTSGRIRFLGWKWLLRCVRDRVLCALARRRLAHPTCPARRGEGRSLPEPERGERVPPGSGPAEPCTNRHTRTHIMHDQHQREAQLPFMKLNSRTAITNCSPPPPIKTNSLDSFFQWDWQIGMTVIHPQQPPSSPHSACHSQSACSERRDSFLPLP